MSGHASTPSSIASRWSSAQDGPSAGLPARFRRRRPIRGPGRTTMVLNVTAMIDVVFLLMTYFLLIAQFRTGERILPLALPRRLETAATTTNPPEDPFELPPRPVSVLVRSIGPARTDLAVSVDDPSIPAAATLDELARSLAAARGITLPADQLIAVRPAPDTRWEHTISVFSALRGVGFQTVRLSNPGSPTGAPLPVAPAPATPAAPGR